MSNDTTRQRIIKVLTETREQYDQGSVRLNGLLHRRMADALIAEGLATAQETPKKTRKGSSPVPVLMRAAGEWITGAVLVLVVAACLLGPGIYDEIMEDSAMSVLDMSGGDIADTPLADLVDLRGYVDEYAGDKDADPDVAGKAAKILDDAIEDRIQGGVK